MISKTPSPVSREELKEMISQQFEVLTNTRGSANYDLHTTTYPSSYVEDSAGNTVFNATKGSKPQTGLASDPPSAVTTGACFSIMCGLAGLNIEYNVRSVSQLSDNQLQTLSGLSQYKIFLVVYALDDIRNHVELIDASSVTAKVLVKPILNRGEDSRTVVCTSTQHFFNKGNEWVNAVFYSAEGFGSATGASRPAPYETNMPQSIVADSVNGGESNVSAGVSRSRKRIVAAKSSALGGPVAKNYRVTNAILFNNADEMYQDKISRSYAQEIIEELFEVWGIPLDQPEAAKYAEDLLWTFIVAVTASNKADYNVTYMVPVKPVERNGVMVSSVEADFSKLSLLLASKYGVTRRQFSRGVSDDLRAFLKHEDNQELLPPLATRVGCEVMLAYLAFDGSTHCSNMTTREVTFTRTLESRNLFERDDVIAQGASDKLMQGMSGGVRSVAPR